MVTSNARPENATSIPFQGSLYDDSCEQQRHLGNMRAIAEEVHRPVDEIAEVYEEILRRMKAGASIQDYLSILVSKKVKQVYREY